MKSTPELLSRAVAIAAAAHEGQRDKAGAAYILHPIRMMMVASTDDERIVAMLHDVVEDSEWTLAGLRAEGFPEHILAGIEAITRRENETYDEYIRRVAQNPIALRVKILDIEDNMSVSRLTDITDGDVERLRRYLASRRTLAELAANAAGGDPKKQ